MKLKHLLFLLAACSLGSLKAQFEAEGRVLTNDLAPMPKGVSSRSASNPKTCGTDTSRFPSYGTTAYNSITVKTGSALGQFFDTPQDLYVSGFRFYGFSTHAAGSDVNVICKLYKAGLDSLPTGSALATDTLTLDTVAGSSIPLTRIERNAVWSKVKVDHPYIVVIESDSASSVAALVSNSWSAGNGKKKNLCVGSVSGKWYRCLSLNVGGTLFDADMQFYPFVQYDLGIDFTISNNCFPNYDTLFFTNNRLKNVSSMPYYNYYVYYNLEYFSHRWLYDGIYSESALNGKYKPKTKTNFDVRLITTVYSYMSNFCVDTVIKTVYFKPSKPTLVGAAKACVGDSATIKVWADAGTSVAWYKTTADPKPFHTGTAYGFWPKQNDTFYVRAINGDCISDWMSIPFSVKSYPQDPSIKNDSICAGATANLQAYSDTGVLNWYSDAQQKNLLFTGNVLQLEKIFKDTGFYVRANNGGCENTGGPTLVKAFVGNDYAPSAPSAASDTFMCLRPSSSLTLSASTTGSDTLRWYDDPTGGSVKAVGTEYTVSPNKRGDFDYYVETWNGLCGSGRTQIMVHVYDYPTLFGPRGDTLCYGDSAYGFASTPWGQVNWYKSTSDTDPFYSGKYPADLAPTGKNYWYLKPSEKGCYSPNWDSVLIWVNKAPDALSADAPSVCTKSLGTMTVKVPYGNVWWYGDSLDSEPYEKGEVLDLGLVLSNRKLYYQTEDNGCFGPKIPLELIAKPRPAAGFTWTLLWQNKINCVPISTANLSFFWDWGDGTSKTGMPGVHQYDASGAYTVRLVVTSTVNGCKDTADIPVLIDHTGVEDILDLSHNVYPNPISKGSIMSVSGFPAKTLVWFDVMGRELAQSEDAPSKEMDSRFEVPSHIQPGTYWIRAVGYDGRVASTKVIVTP